MKRILFTLLMLVGLLGSVVSTSYAQANITTTTLSAAITTTRASTFTVTSATGWTASAFPGVVYYAYVDAEAMLVRSISGTTITVDRGVAGTAANLHASGALIFTGAAANSNSTVNGQTFVTGGPFIQTAATGSAASPSGACTRASNSTLPIVSLSTGVWYNCLGGNWLTQTAPTVAVAGVTPLTGGCNIAIGSVAYASIGTNTTDVASKRMTTSIFVPRTFYSTGLKVLQGGTATTDNITVQIADAGGKILVSGAAAGTLLSGANTFASIPWALNRFGAAQTKTLITGPALYFASVTGNGTAAGAYQTVPTATFLDVLSQGSTSITFGTFPDFTPPTTFTADLAPVVCLY